MRDYIIAFLVALAVLTLQDALPQWWGMFAGKVALCSLVFFTVLGKQSK